MGELQAQSRNSAKLVGTVTDASGALVQKHNREDHRCRAGTSPETTTNQKGAYEMPFLDCGSYTIEFQATGFDRVVRQGIVLELDQVARVDTQLKIGSTNEVITVSGNPPILNTDDSQRGAGFRSHYYREPSHGRARSLSLPSLSHRHIYGAKQRFGSRPWPQKCEWKPGLQHRSGVQSIGGNGVLPNSDNFVTLVPALAAVEPNLT